VNKRGYILTGKKRTDRPKREISRHKRSLKSEVSEGLKDYGYKAMAKYGGLLLAPDGTPVAIPSNSNPVETVEKYGKLIAKHFDYALDFLAKAETNGTVPASAWDALLDLLLVRGWVQIYGGEIVAGSISSTLLKRIKALVINGQISWPDDSIVHFIDANSGKAKYEAPFEELDELTRIKDLKLLSSKTRQTPRKTTRSDREELDAIVDSLLTDKELILEAKSFRQLMMGSESGRRSRARKMQTKPPEVYDDEDGNEVMRFNFKAIPSTTGNRQKGYALFKRRKGRGRPTKLENTPVEVSCSCPDYKYRWEVANKKAGSSRIIFSNGKDPNITNPTFRPGLCKHLIALGSYISGLRFEDEPEPEEVEEPEVEEVEVETEEIEDEDSLQEE